ncbi:hypothetical protein Q9L42_020465 (plasmid) [Methylomarinum sp. Ch1-1]|uniref:Uncharacterized protein n=1 Tax=Methylomarinum roseum TaxID=3067653 RepID=A0AAU7P019_9GAMM|nr:hypothetical protein [Methylomarinum sp. Ch1-1]MDP4523291.1 hypothetical protein [Methylomarinum sp. Ch1-1]
MNRASKNNITHIQQFRASKELEGMADEETAADQWIAQMDSISPFDDLDALREILNECPDRTLEQYHWLGGLIMGRSVNEEIACMGDDPYATNT